jgi:hypothetical protein
VAEHLPSKCEALRGTGRQETGGYQARQCPELWVFSDREGFQVWAVELDFTAQKAAHRSINLSLLLRFFLCVWFPATPYTHTFTILFSWLQKFPLLFSSFAISLPAFIPCPVYPWVRAQVVSWMSRPQQFTVARPGTRWGCKLATLREWSVGEGSCSWHSSLGICDFVSLSFVVTPSLLLLLFNFLVLFYCLFSLFLFSFWWDWGLQSGFSACKAGGHKTGALPLEPHLQSVLLWLFWRWGSCGPKPQSVWSQPPKQVGLQAWTTGSWLDFLFLVPLSPLIPFRQNTYLATFLILKCHTWLLTNREHQKHALLGWWNGSSSRVPA